MTADEFLVERYLKLEKTVEELEEVIDDKDELLDQKREEILEYQELVQVLSKYIKVNDSGVCFFLSNFIDDDRADIELLAEFFELGKEKGEI
jgi:hypothetical protein